jgi:hypothetical protein
MDKPRLFIGSASEGLDIAHTLQALLAGPAIEPMGSTIRASVV